MNIGTAIGLNPAYVATASQVQGPGSPVPVQLGNAATNGVPQPNSLPGGGGAGVTNYTGAAPHQQPVFWLVVMLALGVIILSHVALVSKKG